MKKAGSARWTNLSRGISILLALMLAIQLFPLTARAEETNILKNPNFANDNAEGWDNHGNWNYNNGEASLTISAGDVDWAQSLMQADIVLEEHYAYNVSATITSTIDRQVVMGFEGITGEERAYSFQLTANEAQAVTFTTSHTGTGKFGKDVCSTHYILEADLNAIVLDDLRRVTHFARQNERRFAEYIGMKRTKEAQKEIRGLEKQIAAMTKRQSELMPLFKRLYEDI